MLKHIKLSFGLITVDKDGRRLLSRGYGSNGKPIIIERQGNAININTFTITALQRNLNPLLACLMLIGA